MDQKSVVRVFIGSGEASLLERKAMIHSLRKNTSRELEISVFNGTHNTVERDGTEPQLVPMPLGIKYRNFTEFSNYRWYIPQLCGHQGRAIYVDSDMLCLGDIGELFDAPLDGNAFLAKAEAYSRGGATHWGLSVVLFDCSLARFDAERYFREIDAGLYTDRDLHEMSPAFLKHHPFAIGRLDPHWNVFDQYDAETRLIHYTNLLMQPWKFPGHPHEALWFQHFHEARQAGVITQRDVEVSMMRAYARQDILNPAGRLRRPLSAVRQLGRGVYRRLHRIGSRRAA